jgi:hypothetical protein
MPWFVVLPLGRGFIFGHLWILGISTSCVFLASVVLAGFYFGALFFWFGMGRCICGLHIEFL